MLRDLESQRGRSVKKDQKASEALRKSEDQAWLPFHFLGIR
jgi:hypothetical protein